MPRQKKPKRYVRRSERVGDKVRTHYLGKLSDPVTRALEDGERLRQASKRFANDTAEIELQLQERLEACQHFLATKIARLVRRQLR